MSSLADISIRRPVFAWMLMAALVIFGGIAFTRLGVSQLPDVDFPVITVSLALEGAAPEIMESDVVDIVEDVLTTIEGVREISSSSRQGQASVTVEFELERNIDLALQDVQTRIAQAQRRLPRELEPPTVTKTNPEDQPILWLGLGGTKSPGEIADFARFELRPRLQTIPGVAEVMMGGYRERSMRVWLDRARLEKEGVTVPELLLALEREHIEVPAGRVETAARERNVRSEGEALTAAEVGEVVIASRAGRPVKVRDVAAVEFGLEDKRRIARVNGLPGVGLGVKKQRGANAVEVARRVRAEVERARATLPAGYELGINVDTTRFIEESTRQIQHEIVLAVLLTSLVCWAFLGSWAATFNVLLAIPTSIVGVFAAFYFLGFTLNTFTLLGLTLAIGIVVDDAIMVLENIFRHREMGKGRVRAAGDGAREISFAAVAATVAIIAIFLPVAFMKGIMGKFFYQFGVTLSLAVALSLLEALTLTPMRCSQMGGIPGHTTRMGRLLERLFRALEGGYRGALARALGRPSLVLVLCFGLFAASVGLIGRVGREFVPPQDQGRILGRIVAPVGSSVDYTDGILRRAEAVIGTYPEVRRTFAAVGGFGGGEVNTAILFVTLAPPAERVRTQGELMQLFRRDLNAIPDAKAFIQDLSLSGFSAQRGFPVEFSIRGPSLEVLAAKEDEIRRRMAAAGLYVDIDSDYLVGMPEIRLKPVRDRAADLGVSMDDIGRTVATLIGGVRVGKFKEGGHRYDMRVRLLAPQRVRTEDIEGLYVRSRSGALVRLDQVVRTEQVPTLLTIQRRGRERAISIFANVAPGASQDRALAEVERIAAEVLPEGYKIVFSGSAQTFRESFESLLFALVLGIAVAYMVLASQFNSYLHPVTVLLALPFSVTGALLAIYAGGFTLNIFSMIGLVLLMGIVKKNSIILVDYTNQRRAAVAEGRAGSLRNDRLRSVPGRQSPPGDPLAARLDPEPRSEVEHPCSTSEAEDRQAAAHGRPPAPLPPGPPDEVRDALLHACPVRLRPILMTSIATIASAVPAALHLGPGGEARAPMAAAVIGGVLVSTLLTLFVVPCFYIVAERLRARVFGRPPAAPADDEARLAGAGTAA